MPRGKPIVSEIEQRLRAIAPSCAYKVIPVAAAMEMSERQLRRVVRAAFGMSPNRWLRMERSGAVLRLLSDAKSVKEVAFSLGYAEASQFSRDFKNQFGCTPSSVLSQPAKLKELAATLRASDGRFYRVGQRRPVS